MALHAVITGDLVQSRQVSARNLLLDRLRQALVLMRETYQATGEIYRGDSFQLLIPEPVRAIHAALLIRAFLIAAAPDKTETWDARLSLGIGGVADLAEQIAESDGEAFLLSGSGLDRIARGGERLLITTPWQEINTRLCLITRFADDIISHWSHYSAETVFYNLLYNEPQTELAERLNRSQATISKRMLTAKLELIRAYITEVEEILSAHLKRL